MNKTKGNMYPWIKDIWNPINGACPHACSYCYVPHTRARKLYEGEIHLNDNAMKKNLGKDKFYFVGSCFDIFANNVSNGMLTKVIAKCFNSKFNFSNPNTFLFQTKNPERFVSYFGGLIDRKNIILGTTIETNHWRWTLQNTKAPRQFDRAEAMSELTNARKMVSIEPIMDFDPPELVKLIKICNPEFVSIGADSKGHNLPEPPADKIKNLISELSKFTKVYEKDNLRRLR